MGLPLIVPSKSSEQLWDTCTRRAWADTCYSAAGAMPGLLQTPGGSLRSYKIAYAFLAEMIGTMIFSLYGSATTLSGSLP